MNAILTFSTTTQVARKKRRRRLGQYPEHIIQELAKMSPFERASMKIAASIKTLQS